MKEERKVDETLIYDDEIDLYELWLKLKKRWKIIVGSTGMFVLVSLLYILLTPPIYESSFFIKIPSYESQDKRDEKILFSQDEVIERLKKFYENNKEEFKESFKTNSLSFTKLRQDKRTIKVSLEVYDTKYINKIKDKLINYLNSSRYLIEKINKEKSLLRNQIKEIEKGIKEMEALKQKIVNKLNTGELESLGFNPLEIEQQIIQAKNELILLKTQLQSLRGFEVSVEPTIPEEPSKPKKALILAVSSVSGLFLGIFLALFLEWLEEARRKHLQNLN